MRTRMGWAATAVGALCVLAGLALAVVLGPDSRFTTGPHAIDTDGVAVVTAPGVIDWKGVQVDVLAEVPVGKPVFVGLGNSVDVQDYVRRAQHVEVTSFSRPWTLRTRDVKGNAGLPGAPTALDWWLEDSAGLGGASISVTLPDETVSLAVMAVGATNLSGLEVTVAHGVRGGFAKGLGLALAGAGLVWGGQALRRGDPLVLVGDDEDEELLEEIEEVVYVWIDEDGVEHEISEEEAERLQAEHEPTEQEQDEPERAEPQPVVPPPDLEDPDRPPAVRGVVTAGDVVAGHVPDDPPAPVVPDAPPAPEPEAERVVYVFVDEDGVEHEVSEDELDAFEVVDEDEEDRS